MTESDPEPDWAAIRRRHFISDLLSEHKWFASASELQAAADLLKPRAKEWWASLAEWHRKERPIFLEHGCHRAYMMLAGFVVENLCKGALLPRLSWEERQEVHVTARLPKWSQSHNLRSLVRRTGMAVDEKEQELLHRMSRMVKWEGRYPVAARFDHEGDTLAVDDGTRYSATWIGEKDIDRIDEFCDRLREYVGARRSYRVVRAEG